MTQRRKAEERGRERERKRARKRARESGCKSKSATGSVGKTEQAMAKKERASATRHCRVTS